MEEENILIIPDQPPVNAVDFLAQFRLWSRERMAFASKSELRRWLKAGNVICNGKTLAENAEVDFPVESLIIFPKGKRITLR
jgi:hypothetical protein